MRPKPRLARPQSIRKISIIFGVSQLINFLKLLQKFQAPLFIFCWVMAATDRQTDVLVYYVCLSGFEHGPVRVGFVVDTEQWERFLPEYFNFPLSISFHHCSVLLSIKSALNRRTKRAKPWDFPTKLILSRKFGNIKKGKYFHQSSKGLNIFSRLIWIAEKSIAEIT
jgi:hypothetical protein